MYQDYGVRPITVGWWDFCVSLLYCLTFLALSSNGRRLSLQVGLDCLSQKDLCVAEHQQPSTAATLQPSLLGIFSRPSASQSHSAFNMISPAFIFFPSSYFMSPSPSPLKCQVVGMQLKKCCIFIWCLCRHKTTVWGTLGAKKVSSVYLPREDKHGEINTELSCCSRVRELKWSQQMRLRGPYQSRMCPGTERSMLLCDKGVRADKRVCVKCFKDELNSDIKVWFEKEGRGWRGGRGVYSWHLLCCRDVFISSCTLKSVMEKPAGNTDMTLAKCTSNIQSFNY